MESDLQFKPDPLEEAERESQHQPWKVIVSDDDAEVHAVTRLALEDFTFEGRSLQFFSAYSGQETRELINAHPDTAVLLLDVVMEHENTGLELVEYIRKELRNSFVRIILRTGQPGQAPQMQVIRDFDINDYKEKIELTDQKLYTTVMGSIRAYRDMRLIEQHRREIERSLIEKEVMLKEIHHRVKNNLQVISSLLSMQSAKISDELALQMFQDSRDRVRTMAIIHEKLYQSENLSKVDFADYIRTMVQELTTLYRTSGRIEFRYEIEEVLMGIDKAVPCGLIVNELLTNSLKYAFPGRERGSIRIALRGESGRIQMELEDDGIGLPEDIDPAHTDTLGLQLVWILASQIEADLQVFRENGTRYSILFPEQ